VKPCRGGAAPAACGCRMDADMRRFRDWLIYLAVRMFICLIQTLRLETCQQVSRLLAVLACDVLKIRGAVVDDNLRHAFPHWDPAQRRRCARRMWEHLLLMACEIAHAPRKIHETNWRRCFRLVRKRELVGYLLGQRPVLLVSGHFGNFEMGSYATGLLGFPGYSVARTLDNPYLDRFLNRFRGAYGQHIVAKSGSAGQLESVLASGGLICLLGDQHAGPKGCWVDFLGRPASCHKALAVLTLSGGAPLLVSSSRRVGGPLQLELQLWGVADPQVPTADLANVKTLTRWYNRVLEQAIRQTPEQYWWVHRRWKGEPPRRRPDSPPSKELTNVAPPALDRSAA
jgi:Kdo2-lipid IVA lauroyltransferase/acyltransferase